MHVYLDEDGNYRNNWSDYTLIPSEDDLRWIAMLDAAADRTGSAILPCGLSEKDGTPSSALRGVNNKGVVSYIIPGSGRYIEDRDC